MLKVCKNRVLYGHSIADPDNAPHIGPEKHNRVSTNSFENFIARHGHKVSITLDDGYVDNLTTALPILEKHNVSATIFVTTGFVSRTYAPMERVAALVAEAFTYDNDSMVDLLERLGVMTQHVSEDESLYSAIRASLKPLSVSKRMKYQIGLMEICGGNWDSLVSDMLTPEQVSKLDDHPLISVGAHTISHPNLLYAEADELKTELIDSKKALEDWISRPVTEMAYPYGANDRRVRQAVAEVEYKRAFATEPNGWIDRMLAYNPLSKPRYDLGLAIQRECRDG